MDAKIVETFQTNYDLLVSMSDRSFDDCGKEGLYLERSGGKAVAFASGAGVVASIASSLGIRLKTTLTKAQIAEKEAEEKALFLRDNRHHYT